MVEPMVACAHSAHLPCPTPSALVYVQLYGVFPSLSCVTSRSVCLCCLVTIAFLRGAPICWLAFMLLSTVCRDTLHMRRSICIVPLFRLQLRPLSVLFVLHAQSRTLRQWTVVLSGSVAVFVTQFHNKSSYVYNTS